MTKPKPSASPKRKAWCPLKVWREPGMRDWWWHLEAKNGRVVADGSEGYYSKAKALQGFKSAAKLAAKALAQMEGGK